jgi:glycosyltransferase involved in cell wall biosynthesis
MTVKRIVVLASYAPSLLNFRREILQELAARGHDVVACAPGGEPRLRVELADLGVRFAPVSLDRSGLNPLRDLHTIRQLRALLRKLRPDLLFTYTAKPVIYGGLVARQLCIPVVSLITGRGSLFGDHPAGGRVLRPLTARLCRAALARNSAIVFQNPDDRHHFVTAGFAPSERCHEVAGSGVNLEIFRPAPLPGGPVRFLLVARLLVDKGIREYAEASRMLRERGYPVECDLVGPLERHPRAIARGEVEHWQAAGLLRWHGGVEDIRPHLQDCTVYVLPSYHEGAPRSVLEALATGRPIITTDAPGCRQTVIDGCNGLLVPVGDAAALAAAMQQMIERPDQLPAMAAASLNLARSRYDVQLVNRELMAILEGVLAPQTAGPQTA